MDGLPVIKLGVGKGKPGEAACWMSALSQWLGGEWTDELSCVSPAINKICITINDHIATQEDREKLILPILFLPLGTYDEKNESKREAILTMAHRAANHYMNAEYAKWKAEKAKGRTPQKSLSDIKDHITKEIYLPALHKMIAAGKHAPEEPACAIPIKEWGELCGATCDTQD